MPGLKLSDTEGSISKEATDSHEHNVHAHVEKCLCHWTDALLDVDQQA